MIVMFFFSESSLYRGLLIKDIKYITKGPFCLLDTTLPHRCQGLFTPLPCLESNPVARSDR